MLLDSASRRPECVRREPEPRNVTRNGFVAGPTGHPRGMADSGNIVGANADARDDLFARMQRRLPFGSTALLP